MAGPAPVLMQIGVADVAGQRLLETRCITTPGIAHTVPGHDGLGERLWLEPQTRFEVSYKVTVEIDRQPLPLADLAADPLTALPGEVLEYLFPRAIARSTRCTPPPSTCSATSPAARL
ncbi:hypothetical protein C7W88_15500 [Novosphingobium sp. THN1]|uniref:hypothetical protein n=1 Tax=Novosphingobium sp. THN1 TaxID=1016987 RepID=UPI000E5376F6|nr:hypothetical protein C7W88_15500 [Novosphingobium sp. THN1]